MKVGRRARPGSPLSMRVHTSLWLSASQLLLCWFGWRSLINPARWDMKQANRRNCCLSVISVCCLVAPRCATAHSPPLFFLCWNRKAVSVCHGIVFGLDNK